MRAGESLALAVARELREELGVVITAPTEPPFQVLRDEIGAVELSIWLFDHDRDVENRAPREHDELRWVGRDEVDSLALADPAYVAVLGQAFDR